MILKKSIDTYRNSLWLNAIGVSTFGLVALCYPGPQIQALVFPFGALVTLSGVVTILQHLERGQQAMRWKGIAEGLLGVTALAAGGVSLPVFMALIALWTLLTGSMMVNRFTRLKDQVPNCPIMVIAGLSAVLFGLFVVVSLATETIAVTYEIAVFALLLGGSMFYGCAQLKESQQAESSYLKKDLFIHRKPTRKEHAVYYLE